MSDIKKRIAAVKARRFGGFVSLPLRATKRWAEKQIAKGMDPKLIADIVKGQEELAAMKFFESDPDSYAALDRAKKCFETTDTETLALLMAEILFGKTERGRSRGTKTWTEQEYLNLADAAGMLWKKNPKLSDARIATLLSKTEAFKKYSAEVLRQRMKEAKRAAWDYLQDMAIEEAD